MYNSVLWDRLAGMLDRCIQNYMMQKQIDAGENKAFPNLQPDYEVDYTISDDILHYIEQSGYGWVSLMCNCKNINDLPRQLKKTHYSIFTEVF